jgi:glycosyltransferase involved in cell wall biosynthesis
VKILLLITDLEIGGTPTVVRELAIRLTEPGRLRRAQSSRVGPVSPHSAKFDDPAASFGPDETASRPSRVTVACLSQWGPVADQLRDAGVEVVAFNARRPADLIATARRLVSLIRDERFDTVFIFLIHANFVAALASRFCPGVRFLQSIQTTQPSPRWHWRLQSLLHYAADRIVVPSPSAAQAAVQWADVPQEKIVVIPNAVDFDSGSGTGGPPVSFLPDENHGRAARATIGFIGRLDPIKRVPDLLEAMALLSEHYTLHLFGDGSDRPRIESEIVRLNLQNRVTLHGTIARPQDAFASIDALVLPSAAEGFGLVLIEAMAAGVPVVATDVPGIRDVVRDGTTGILVPIASPSQLAAAIRLVCEESRIRDRLMRNGLAEVRERFSWDVVLPQYKMLLGTTS